MSGARGGGSAFPHAAAELQALEVFDDVENMLSNAQQSGGNIGGGQQQAQQQAPLQGSSLRAARGLVASSSAPSLIPHSGQQQPAAAASSFTPAPLSIGLGSGIAIGNGLGGPRSQDVLETDALLASLGIGYRGGGGGGSGGGDAGFMSRTGGAGDAMTHALVVSSSVAPLTSARSRDSAAWTAPAASARTGA
jgi:hypothetical protein